MHKVSDRNFTMVYFSPFYDFLSFVMHSAAGELYTREHMFAKIPPPFSKPLRPHRNWSVYFRIGPLYLTDTHRLLNFIRVVHSRARWTLPIALSRRIYRRCFVYFLCILQAVGGRSTVAFASRSILLGAWHASYLRYPPVRIFLTPSLAERIFQSYSRAGYLCIVNSERLPPQTLQDTQAPSPSPFRITPETRYKSPLRNAVAFLRNYPTKWSHCFACLTCLN